MSINYDLQHFRSSYLKIQEELERLSRIVNPTYLGIYEQMERALEPIRHQHQEISRTIALSSVIQPHLMEIAQANERIQNVISQAYPSNHVFEDLTRIHQSWTDAITPLQASIAHVQASAKLAFSDVAYRLTITERIFAGIDFNAMQQAIRLPELTIQKFQNTIGHMTLTYEKLAASIKVLPDVTYLPKFVFPGASREVFITGYALDNINPQDGQILEEDTAVNQLIDEVAAETFGCIELLKAVDPALAIPYCGAHDAFQSRNADRSRHILSSMREFWTHLLQRLAPDENVLEWISEDKGVLLHEGRPTRRARILYVCRNLNQAPLTNFVMQDTAALINLIDIFNRIHELQIKLTDEQLRALLLRTDSWLMYILQIWKGDK